MFFIYSNTVYVGICRYIQNIYATSIWSSSKEKRTLQITCKKWSRKRWKCLIFLFSPRQILQKFSRYVSLPLSQFIVFTSKYNVCLNCLLYCLSVWAVFCMHLQLSFKRLYLSLENVPHVVSSQEDRRTIIVLDEDLRWHQDATSHTELYQKSTLIWIWAIIPKYIFYECY